MSEIKKEWLIPSETVEKLAYISKEFHRLNTGSTGDEFWLIVADDIEGDYEGCGLALGINKNGELIQAEDSHCSCNSNFEDGFTAYGHQPLSGALTVKYDIYQPFDDWLPELITTADALEKVLKGKDVDAKSIIGLPNAEIRRAVVELVGYDKIVADAKTLNESADGKLLKIELPNDEDMVLVHVKDPSTEREYFLRVPPTITTAREARAWTFGFSADDFELAHET